MAWTGCAIAVGATGAAILCVVAVASKNKIKIQISSGTHSLHHQDTRVPILIFNFLKLS